VLLTNTLLSYCGSQQQGVELKVPNLLKIESDLIDYLDKYHPKFSAISSGGYSKL
jgi:hypothetical protein